MVSLDYRRLGGQADGAAGCCALHCDGPPHGCRSQFSRRCPTAYGAMKRDVCDVYTRYHAAARAGGGGAAAGRRRGGAPTARRQSHVAVQGGAAWALKEGVRGRWHPHVPGCGYRRERDQPDSRTRQNSGRLSPAEMHPPPRLIHQHHIVSSFWVLWAHAASPQATTPEDPARGKDPHAPKTSPTQATRSSSSFEEWAIH